MFLTEITCHLWKILLQPFYQEIAAICLIHIVVSKKVSIVDDTSNGVWNWKIYTSFIIKI